MRLTAEQDKAVVLFSRAQNLKIEALAGTGKTSTLVALAKSNERRRGTYLAFNGSVATDATRRFHSGVHCSTSHALAFKRLSEQGFSADKLVGKPNVCYVETMIPAGQVIIPVRQKKDGLLRLSRRRLSLCILETLEQFQRSGDEWFRPHHAPSCISRFELHPTERQYLFDLVLPSVEQLWDRAADKNSSTGLGHDGYLKLWAMRAEQIQSDYILLDEAQDTSDVLLGALRRQDAQIILVGDTHQQIYGWRGAINALGKFETELTCALTQSFRFGSKIAEVAGGIVTGLGSLLRLTGLRSHDEVVVDSQFHKSRAILCKKNGTILKLAQQALSSGKKVCILGGSEELASAVEAIEHLECSSSSDHPDLFGFTGLTEFREFCSEFPSSAGILGSVLRLKETWEKGNAVPLRKVLGSLEPDDKKADLTLATIFRAKGMEWDSVHISDDFVQAAGFVLEETRRQNYVACTRAQTRLSLSPEAYNSITF